MKRIWSLFLSVSFLLAAFALPGTAYAATTASGTCGPVATWTFDSATGVLKIEGSGAVTASEDWPSGIVRVEAGDQITSIADKTFESKGDLIEADLPGVTTIGERAFYECEKLTKVNAPNVTSMGESAFWECIALQQVDFPKITVLSAGVFGVCTALQSVNMPNLEKTLSVRRDNYSYAFGSFTSCSSLEKVNFPKLTTVGRDAFENCKSLTVIDLPQVVEVDSGAFQGCLALKEAKLPLAQRIAGASDDPYTGSYSIGAFNGCTALEKVDVSSVKGLWSGTFYDCTALQQVVAPNLQSFGDAFVNCPALQELDISNYSGKASCFQYLKSAPSLETIRIAPDNAKYAVQDGVVLTKDLQSIVYMAPKNPIKNMDLPQVTQLEDRAFAGCTNLETISLPNVTEIDYSAFDGCTNLETISLPNATKIGNAGFRSCTNLETISLPNVTYIGNEAFDNCTNLETISLPNATRIGNEAFDNCARLKEVRISDRGTQLTIGAKAFNKCRRLTGLLVDGSYENLWPKLQVDETAMDPLTHVRLMFPITYDANGGTDAPAAERKVLGDDLTLTTREPRRSGYVFAGWSTTVNGTVNYQPGDRYTADESATLYAVWQKAAENYTLHYSTDQGVPVPASQTAAGGTQVKLSTVVPRKSGYVFLGWADRKGGTPAYRAGDAYTLQQNTTLYAVWQAQEPAPEVHVYRTKVQPATWSADGRSYEVCDQCGAVRNTRVIAKTKTASLSAVNYTYDGKTKQPTVTVKNSKGKTLKRGTDYTVSYSSGSKNVGRYTVKVTLKGNYSGSKSLTYNINPKGTSVSKVTAAKKGFKVTWKKQATQTTGYEVQYSTSSNFKKGNKTVNIAKNKTTSKSVSKLSAKKKYYVRVRTYKTVKINGKNVKFYSGWSGAKSVTTKK